MNKKDRKILLVGDNPFQGVSHLTQERERTRNELITRSDYAANLVSLSIDNGADGFMFSLNENTVSLLKIIREKRQDLSMRLYPTVPSAYEYVRLSSQSGTVGLMMHVAKQVVISGDFKAMAFGVQGVVKTDPTVLLKAYLNYELSRMKPLTNSRIHVHSLLLHEIVTDMALALNWDWLFQTYVKYLSKLGIKPGFALDSQESADYLAIYRVWIECDPVMPQWQRLAFFPPAGFFRISESDLHRELFARSPAR